MSTVYMRIALVGMIPVLASVVLYLLNRRTGFGRLGDRTKQLIYGLVFSALAVAGTEFGVPSNGVMLNARDAAPLCAGLIFGAPAGMLAGIIGGVERWFAAYWGRGYTTQLACSLATAFSGLFGAGLRKWMFDDKRPAWYYGFAAGLVAEVLHMLMVFVTNMCDVQQAFAIIQIASLPMITVNSLCVMLAVMIVNLLGRGKTRTKKSKERLAQAFSGRLLIVVTAMFCITCAFSYALQTRSSDADSEALLRLNIEDARSDIEDASDTNLLRLTRSVAREVDEADELTEALLVSISAEAGNDFSEINVIDEQGIIFCSTNPEFLGFHMADGEQSAEFLALLDGSTAEYVQDYRPITANGSYMKYAGVALNRGGFVQVGYNAERFARDIDENVVDATKNRHVGESGYILIAGEDWNIVSGPGGNVGKNLDVSGIWIDKPTMPEYTRYRESVYGVDSYWMYATAEGYSIVAVEPVAEAEFGRNLSLYVTMFMEVLIFAALFILIYALIKILVVDNIHRINTTLGEITGGNLDVSVNVRSNEEFTSLSDDINSTVATLKGYIAEAAARIDRELEVARVIQSSSLPSVFPPWPERTDLDIFALMDTAKEVGGDFYDFYLLDDDHLAFLIADVSGKGITAAMFMMKAKTVLKGYAEQEGDVAKALSLANAALCDGNDAEMFVTCWMGILDFRTHLVTFASAGHNPPLVCHGNGNYEYLKSRPGLVLGGMEGIQYESATVELNPGDEIFLYTDGVTEATDANVQLYGDDRLYAAINTLTGKTAEEICHGIKKDVDAFVGDAPQFDDITMLSLRLTMR